MQLKIGNKFTLKHINQVVTIVHHSLGPGGTNLDTAYVTVETAKGVPYTIPAKLADRYLTTDLPVRPGKLTSKS